MYLLSKRMETPIWRVPPLQGAKFKAGRDDASASLRKTEAARGRDPQSRARVGGGKGGVQPGRPRGEPGGRGQACWCRDRNIVSALSDQRGPIRGGLPARGGTAACRTGQVSRRSENSTGRGAAPLAAGWRRIHGDEEGHGCSARHGRARLLGACDLLARSADLGGGGAAAACR